MIHSRTFFQLRKREDGAAVTAEFVEITVKMRAV